MNRQDWIVAADPLKAFLRNQGNASIDNNNAMPVSQTTFGFFSAYRASSSKLLLLAQSNKVNTIEISFVNTHFFTKITDFLQEMNLPWFQNSVYEEGHIEKIILAFFPDKQKHKQQKLLLCLLSHSTCNVILTAEFIEDPSIKSIPMGLENKTLFAQNREQDTLANIVKRFCPEKCARCTKPVREFE